MLNHFAVKRSLEKKAGYIARLQWISSLSDVILLVHKVQIQISDMHIAQDKYILNFPQAADSIG